VLLSVVDNDGFSDEDTAPVTITEDTSPPDLGNLAADPTNLWPPNHKMVPVTVHPNVEDACPVSCRIVGVTSNEAENGNGDGNTSPDWRLTGDLSLNLRAERSGNGVGRIYTVTVECTDQNSNQTASTVEVAVALSQSGHCPRLELLGDTVTSAESHEECEIFAGPNYTVVGPSGVLTLTAGASVTLSNGFLVETDATLTIGIDPNL
jgi:hypothetical protein